MFKNKMQHPFSIDHVWETSRTILKIVKDSHF